jgi:hypothetical protein
LRDARRERAHERSSGVAAARGSNLEKLAPARGGRGQGWITKRNAFDKLVWLALAGSRDQYCGVDLGAGDERRVDAARDARVEVEAVGARAVRAARRAARIQRAVRPHRIADALEAALEREPVGACE